MSLVALTSASLADVEPEIAGAASGLVNVSQQLGAAIGLAVLVTVFNSVAGHAQLIPGATPPASVHALRDVFAVAGLFAWAPLATVVFGVGRSAGAELRAPATTSVETQFSVDLRCTCGRRGRRRGPARRAALSA